VSTDLKRHEAAIPDALQAANAGSANAPLLLGRACNLALAFPRARAPRFAGCTNPRQRCSP